MKGINEKVHFSKLSQEEIKYCAPALEVEDKIREIADNFKSHIGMDALESAFIFCLVRDLLLKNKKVKITEISPNTGWSTRIFKEAWKAAGPETLQLDIRSYDINSKSKQEDEKSDRLNRNLVLGDVKETIFRQENLKFLLESDYVFIDSDHCFEFGKFLATKLLPLAKPNCFLTVHDWAGIDYTGHQKRRAPYLPEDGLKKWRIPEGYWKAVPSGDSIIMMSEVGALKEYGIFDYYDPICNFTDITYKIFSAGSLTVDGYTHSYFSVNQNTPPEPAQMKSVLDSAKYVTVENSTGKVLYSLQASNHGINSTQFLVRNNKKWENK